MGELNERIAGLELRCAQMVAHLRLMGRDAPGVELARSTLLMMLENLAALKAERQRREDGRAFGAAA